MLAMSDYGLQSKRSVKLVEKLKKKIRELGGACSWYSGDSDDELMFSIHLAEPTTEANCVASIDWLPDSRYDNQRTFNVCTYNENFDFNKADCHKCVKLQRLTVKYSCKLWESENN